MDLRSINFLITSLDQFENSLLQNLKLKNFMTLEKPRNIDYDDDEDSYDDDYDNYDDD